MTVDPATRSANRWLFIGLIAFAVVLCAAVLLWMRYRTERKGGRVFPPTSLLWTPAAHRSARLASGFLLPRP